MENVDLFEPWGGCESVSVSQFAKALEKYSQSTVEDAALELLRSFETMRGLCVIGGVAAIGGVSLLTSYFKRPHQAVNNRRIGIASVIMNLLSGGLVLAAVFVQDGRNRSFIEVIRNYSSTEVLFPWAIMMSGLGAGFNVIVGVAFGILLYFNRNAEMAPPAATNPPNSAVYNVDTNTTRVQYN